MSAVQHASENLSLEQDGFDGQSRSYLTPSASGSYMEEDHADSPANTKRDRGSRPKRKRISPEQLDNLLNLFQQTDTPSYEQRERVAEHLDMSNREVQVWFQNRRAKERNVKQKQQLIEHRERLERVESASNASQSVPTPPFGPTSPTFHTLSSPAHTSGDLLPQAFDPTRRRSLSTSALDFHASTAPTFLRQVDAEAHLDAHRLPPFGPMRPRFQRYHTIYPQYSLGRPSSARSDMPSLRPPPSRLRQLEHRDTEFAAGSEPGSRQEEIMLPLPHPRYRFGHSPTSSFSTSRPSSSTSGTIADRRENRLPPIRMLLDIADGAPADLSPSMSGVTSSHSCSLYSPFSDLQLNTPGSQDGRRADYFSVRETQPARSDNEAVASSQYTFGRNFQ